MPSNRKYAHPWILWGGILFLNILLFVPGYIANWKFGTFFPSSSLPDKDGISAWWIFLVRDNFDLFRISVEWWLMLGILLLLASFKKVFRIVLWLFGIGYVLLLLYQIYYAVSLSLYGQHPYLQNDYVLIKEVLPLLLDQVTGGSIWLYILTAIGIALLIALIGWAYGFVTKRMADLAFRKVPLLVWAVLGLLIIPGSLLVKDKIYRGDYYTFVRITKLIDESLHIPDAGKFDRLVKLPLYQDYQGKTLLERPNIYFLFIESYGRAIGTKKWAVDSYVPAIQGIGDTLDAAGWHSASAYSLAPILGGRSWLSFTTAITGVRVGTHVQFNQLIETYPDYPHIFRYLSSQGYQTVRLTTFSQAKKSPKNVNDTQARFFDFDLWMEHGAFPYTGFEYDFHGGIPDQFALSYANEVATGDSVEGPIAMFFITMASHAPWFPPPPIRDGWQALNEITTDPHHIEIPDSVTRRYDRFMARLDQDIGVRYINAILYDLRAVSHFIREEADENSIFIVLGDHQPPMLTYYEGDGLEVPVHIIAKDSSFIESLSTYGFQAGMEADTTLPAPLYHGGIYSLFMRELLQHYGEDNQTLPVYLPKGI